MPADDRLLVSRISRDASSIRTLLILTVLADHNAFFRQAAPDLFEPLTFHVLGFLFFAFTFGKKTWNAEFIADRCARYLIPFWWAVTGASIAFYFMYQRHTDPLDSVVPWALAALIGNAPFVKPASGFLMLWFLPSLFGLTCLIAFYNSIQARWAKNLALILAILAHLFLPLLPRLTMLWLPFGLAIMANVFVLGLIWQRLLKVSLPGFWGPIVAIVFVASYGTLVAGPVHLEIATFEVVGANAPVTMILQDIAGMTGVLTIVWLAGLAPKFGWMDEVGRNSLWIYLIHPLIYVCLEMTSLTRARPEQGTLSAVLCGILAAFVALYLSNGIAKFISRSPVLMSWISPKTAKHWPIEIYRMRLYARLVGNR